MYVTYIDVQRGHRGLTPAPPIICERAEPPFNNLYKVGYTDVNYYYAESEHCVNNNEWQNACDIFYYICYCWCSDLNFFKFNSYIYDFWYSQKVNSLSNVNHIVGKRSSSIFSAEASTNISTEHKKSGDK